MREPPVLSTAGVPTRARVAPLGRTTLRFLASARAHWLIGALALASASVCLGLGKLADDYWLEAAFRPHPALTTSLERAPWDAFAFARARDHVALRDQGMIPWWSDEHVSIALLRPLSSLTHALDFRLLAGHPLIMHGHSLLWFALLLLGAQRVYAHLVPGRALAGLCLAFFALDHGRAMTIGWVSNRNALVALAIAFHALAEHHVWRSQGERAARLRAGLWLALGLCGAEAAVQVLGYLVAYALCLDRGTLRTRLASLLPYAAVVAAWRLAYSALGYGAVGSTVYVDPGREPLRFAAALVERLPRYLLGALAFPPSDAWSALDILPRPVAALGYALLAFVAGLLVALLVPLARRSALTRFWLVGALLATLPVCANTPNDRMLTATALGASAVLAQLTLALAQPLVVRARALRIFGYGLVAWHLALAPLVLSARVLALGHAEHVLARAFASLPSDKAMAHKTLVLVNPPADGFALYYPLVAAFEGRTLPARFRWLATGESEVLLRRTGPSTLALHVSRGLASNAEQALFTGPGHVRRVGDVVDLPGVRFTTRGLDDHGHVRDADVRFDAPLDGGRIVLVAFRGGRFERIEAPALGETLTLPALDLGRVLMGES